MKFGYFCLFVLSFSRPHWLQTPVAQRHLYYPLIYIQLLWQTQVVYISQEGPNKSTFLSTVPLCWVAVLTPLTSDICGGQKRKREATFSTRPR